MAERVGVFPGLRFPRVVWAWVHDDDDRLSALQRRIEAGVAGFSSSGPAGKAFTGHVTLARLHGMKRAQATALAAFAEGAVERRFSAWRVDAVHLMRSELSSHGAVHSVVATIPLESSAVGDATP